MTDKDTQALLERLRSKAYRREIWEGSQGTADVPCDADDYGAEEYFANPDGPEAADRIEALSSALAAAEREKDAMLQQGQEEGFAAAVAQLRMVGWVKPRDPLEREAHLFADRLENSRRAYAALPAEQEKPA